MSDGLNPPKINRTLCMNGEQFLYIGSFVDNVKRYPRGEDWIDVPVERSRR